jgi:hypothetical protein
MVIRNQVHHLSANIVEGSSSKTHQIYYDFCKTVVVKDELDLEICSKSMMLENKV